MRLSGRKGIKTEKANESHKSEEENSNAFKLSLMPMEMLSHIFRFLNQEDLNIAKLTCRNWHDIINETVPQAVLLNQDQEGNAVAVKDIMKKTVTIGSTSPTANITFNRKDHRVLHKLVIKGPVCGEFFTNQVPKFQNLKVLALDGDTLFSLIKIKQPLLFQTLETLNLIAPIIDGRNPNLLREGKETIAWNIFNVLKFVKCPCIKELVIDGDIDQDNLQCNIDWTRTLLIEFLKEHRGTLRSVKVGESCILQPYQNANIAEPSIGMLKNLHLTFRGERYALLRSYCWDEFIISQKHVETLNLGTLWYQHSHRLLSQLPCENLRRLSFYWNLSTSRRMNGSIFEKFVNLEKLELTYDGTWGEQFCHFRSLGACKKLKTIIMEHILISAKELETLPDFLPNMTSLYLYACGDPKSNVISPDAPFGISKHALRSFLWGLQELSFLFVTCDDFLGDEGTMKEMNDMLSLVGTYQEQLRSWSIGKEEEV